MNLPTLERKIRALKLSAQSPQDIAAWFNTQQPLILRALLELAPHEANEAVFIHAEIDPGNVYYRMEHATGLSRPRMDASLSMETTGPLNLDPVLTLPCWGGRIKWMKGTAGVSLASGSSLGACEYRITLDAKEWPFIAPFVLHQFSIGTGTTHQRAAKSLLAQYYPKMAWDTFYALAGSGMAPSEHEAFLGWLQPYAAGGAGSPIDLDLPDLSAP